MKIPTYKSTPGLASYPECARFAVYRAAHKRLMTEDNAYRRQWNSHVVGVVCVAIFPATGFVAGGALAISLSVLSVSASVAGVIYLALRQQKFMNRRIGDALRREI